MCQDRGVKYDSPIVDTTIQAVASSDDCALLCHRKGGSCRYWEHSTPGKICQLISAISGVTFVGGSNIIAGVNPCPKESDICKFLLKTCDVRLIYPDLSNQFQFFFVMEQ